MNFSRSLSAPVAALGILALLLSTPVGAQLCPNVEQEKARPVPECVDPQTAEEAVCGVGTVSLWPDGFQPARPGENLPADRDSATFVGGPGQVPYATSGLELFRGVDFASDDRMWVAYNAGVQVWMLNGTLGGQPVKPDFPQKIAYADGFERGSPFLYFPRISEQLNYIHRVSAYAVSPDTEVALLSGKAPVGPSIWKWSTTGNLRPLYQNTGAEGETTTLVNYAGTRYGIVGAKNGHITFYNLTTAANLANGCLDDNGSGGCPGVYLGDLSDAGNALWLDATVVGSKLYIVVSTIFPGTPSIWEVSLPLTASSIANAVQRWNGNGVTQGYAPAFVAHGGNNFLALHEKTESVKIYNVGHCLDANGCSNLGSPVWTGSPPSTDKPTQTSLTFSKSGSTPFLHLGFIGGSPDEGVAQDALWDLSELGATAAQTGSIPNVAAGGGTYNDPCHGKPVDYFGRYNRRNTFGLNDSEPATGKFNGAYFYRPSKTYLDIHVLGDGSSSSSPRITTAPTTAGPYWFGYPVPFAASAQSCSGAESWTWFSDNTAATGLGSTSSSAAVTWSLCGSLHCPDETAEVWALKAACASDPDLIEDHANIALSDPRPHIIALGVSPGGTTFPVCSELEFSANVQGRGAINRTWTVRRVGGSGAEDLPNNNGQTLVWDTSDVSLLPPGGIFLDGFEGGGLGSWGAAAGAQAFATATAPATATKALVPKAGSSQDFEILLNASNADGADTESLMITLESLGALAFGTPAITVTDLGGGTFRFTANNQNATEWRWELEDPGNGSAAGCEVYGSCSVLDFSSAAQSIEYSWTPPNVPATFRVTATAANCNTPGGVSAATSVSPDEIDAPDPPAAISMLLDVNASTACTGVIQSGYTCTVGQPIVFNFTYSDASSLEVDWDGNGTWDETVTASGSPQAVQHIYTSQLFTFPKPAFRAKGGGQTSASKTLTGSVFVQ